MLDRCPLCPNRFPPIAGSGPRRCNLLAIGERPNTNDNRLGRVFMGAAGQELDETYLWLAGLRRDEVRLENACRCWAEGNRTPTDNEVDSCSKHFLPRVLDECRPTVILLLGGRACRLADRKLRIDRHHGFPYFGSVLGGQWEGMIWPMYHPGLGINETAKMSNLLEDFERLGEWLKGEWEAANVQEVKRDYALVESTRQLDEYLLSAPLDTLNGVDTESHGKERFSIQISRQPHTGRMILCKDEVLVRRFHDFCRESIQAGGKFVFHHCVHDLDEMQSNRIDLPVDLIHDTMQEAFHQCSLPQGLKDLTYQLHNFEMRSWEDVVWPASIAAVQGWMEEAWALASEELVEEEITQLAGTLCCNKCGSRGRKNKELFGSGSGYRQYCKKKGCVGEMMPIQKMVMLPSAVAAGMKHFLTYSARNEDYNPWDKLKEFWVSGLRGKVPPAWQREWLEEVLGPVPILGIGNCEIGEAVVYGCGDSDWTLQNAVELQRRRGGEQWQIMEGDEDQ